ncbi:3-isopropylmalate dehydratase small subunit [Planctopirus ephydatiae]|uniref:3-isopropylmalate dehydratase n=1 Tax=Planctopirus ephydatiae TaxID=2528019 RepID=A0A518GKW0_9PLAN|nr:3-isopropylmalate dehydratase small subunit [Planctopirus ephydatiae]QDV29219.1 3-isopropylmalate dehydratase small subunit [Planctopirus ephydatiae]
MVQAITQVTGSAVPLLLDDIDTDRIIPARFLRCVTFDGLGEHAFEDDRIQDPSHPFNQAQFQGGKILVAGRNFGCGSSREHAPQALMRWGIQAIIAESYAEIFFGNCVSLGIPCVRASRADLEALTKLISADPRTTVAIDLLAQTVTAQSTGGQQVKAAVQIPPGAKQSLTTGGWDFLGQLLDGEPEVRAQVAKIPYLQKFAV